MTNLLKTTNSQKTKKGNKGLHKVIVILIFIAALMIILQPLYAIYIISKVPAIDMSQESLKHIFIEFYNISLTINILGAVLIAILAFLYKRAAN